MKLFEIKERKLRLNKASSLSEKISLLRLEYIAESAGYQKVPKAQMSVRFDRGNTNTKTQDHAHVFACQNGQGKHLFAVNIDGSGHDGSTGAEIPKKVGDYLKAQGYTIAANYVVESLSLDAALKDQFIVIVIYENP